MSRLDREEIRTFTELGVALWADPVRSVRIVTETLSAVSSLELTSERTLERAASALIGRATREGMPANLVENLHLLGHPFYRLFPEHRFLLVALHRGNWSYQRLARVFDEDVEWVQEQAWRARVQLGEAGLGAAMRYPVGNSQTGAKCPEYDTLRPWTQRFLDDEFEKKSEQLFVQNHLMACASCRKSLGVARELYFAIEKFFPSFAQKESEFQQLQQVVDTPRALNRSFLENSFLESLGVFAARSDAKLGLVFLAVMLVGFLIRAMS